MNSLEQRFIETLNHDHARITNARREVFEVLQHTNEAMSLQDIISRSMTIDRASVYRTINLFQQLHIVNTILVGWKKRFELASPFRPHHHHFVCNACTAVEEIESSSLEQLVSGISQQHNFLTTSHSFEIKGLCRNCQTKNPRQEDL